MSFTILETNSAYLHIFLNIVEGGKELKVSEDNPSVNIY